MLNMNTRAEAR